VLFVEGNISTRISNLLDHLKCEHVSVLKPPAAHDVLEEEADDPSEMFRPGATKRMSVPSSSTAGTSSPHFTRHRYSLLI
jgi:hypothetical protein